MHISSNRRKQFVWLSALALVALLSFSSSTPASKTAAYYDEQLALLTKKLTTFHSAASNKGVKKDSLLKLFFSCRNCYKHVELFTDIFTPAKARILNGPDLLKIDEENPSDSMKAHGLQVVERLLYDEELNRKDLATELLHIIGTVRTLQNDEDGRYYFTDDRIWMAMRLGSFRIISMGISGFDVPLSYHALPETREVLKTLKTVAGFYRAEKDDKLWQRGVNLFAAADKYLAQHNDFNTFDRATFIRSYIVPLSTWITAQNHKHPTAGSYPLNPDAKHLFAEDIINSDFFAPNAEYLPTPERVTLGKRLFYDPILSGDGSRSCASCHKPELAFTDGLVRPTTLSGQGVIPRNTPTLFNAAFQTSQFYDSRARVLEHQMSVVVHNPDEMNGSVLNCLPRLAADTAYARLFKAAYATEMTPISEYNVANAVSSYVRTLISLNSRFDRYMRGLDSITTEEKNGFNLFMGKAKCGTCHYAPLFNGLTPPRYDETESETLAIPATPGEKSTPDADEGRYNFTRHPFHKYAFKTPTVRNVELTAPYMHNGVFATLEQVLDFYNDGGGAGRGIELATQTLPAEKLNLTQKEKQAIIAFLRSMTDTTSYKR